MARCATVLACFARSAPALLSVQLRYNFVQLGVHLMTRFFFCPGHRLDPASPPQTAPPLAVDLDIAMIRGSGA